MSMTLVAFLRKAELPTKTQIQEHILSLGYRFEILDNFEKFYNIEGIACKLNGHETFFETYFSETAEIVSESDWIMADIKDEDTAISFIWGADFAAGASIGLISITLIDFCNALIYYMDDELKYTREMLVAETPEFLSELEKQNKAAR